VQTISPALGFNLQEGTQSFHPVKVNFNVIDKIVKEGYAPDRKIQPEDGYTLKEFNVQGGISYSMKFGIPLIEYTDVGVPEEKTVYGKINNQ